MASQVIQMTEQVTQNTDTPEERIARLQEQVDDLRRQVTLLQSQLTAGAAAAVPISGGPALDRRQIRAQVLDAFPELPWVLRFGRLMLRLSSLPRFLRQAPRYAMWYVLYWGYFGWLERFQSRSSLNFSAERGGKSVYSPPDPITKGSGPAQAAYRLYLRSISEPADSETPAVDTRVRDTPADAIETDLARATDVGLFYLDHLPGGLSSLKGKAVLEVGSGINYGSAMMLACHGARVIVAGRFRPPWDDLYHPRFYSRLREWIGANLPEAGVAPLDRLLECGWHCPEVIGSIAAALEDLSILPESWADIVVSNAAFEHLHDPDAALKSLARVSRPGAIGLYQVDFRDHRGLDTPLEFLLLSDGDFAREFEERRGECGNRYRPSEMTALFEKAGFRVIKFEPTIFAENCYLGEFIPRLRAAEQSRYRDIDAGELRVLSGLFSLVRM